MPVQLYLSEREKSDLTSIARKRKLSIADVIRGWIHKARPKKKRAPKPDPRQTDIFSLGSAARAAS